ncbi:MAG TPA: DUF2382 domain-containing protein [Polyangiaceae bacterium]|nr:DUF2382 domain-containing protein [Polyangiaceae bacterium]
MLPVVEEDLVVKKRAADKGGVRVSMTPVAFEQLVDVPLRRQEVRVVRVAKNQVVDRRLPARRQGNTLVIPVIEEVPFVEKRLVLKEEVHITRIVLQENHRERVVLRKERAQVERLPPRSDSDPKRTKR